MSKVLVIAEAGVNHNGDVQLAKELVNVAADAGADIVKFQTFSADKLVAKTAQKADYQKQTTDANESQFEMIKSLELSVPTHLELIKHCQEKKIRFLSSPFDIESIRLLMELGLALIKIPSGEITNLPYLREVGACYTPVILSTGMSNLGETEAAVKVLVESGTKREKITLLHCNTEYPTPVGDANLSAMLTLKAAFPGCQVGYSDHTIGIEIPIAAVAMGATVIEKHFTLSKDLEGPDHKASLLPNELESMVKAIRNVEAALGHGKKGPSVSEIKNIHVVRKSIVASRFIHKGEKLSGNNLEVKRPGTGISPMEWDKVIGRMATKDYSKDDLIEL
jgi:N,N'-diacetyllegionaminate synthase